MFEAMMQAVGRQFWWVGLGAALLSGCGGGGDPVVADGGRARPMSVGVASTTSIPFYTVRQIDFGVGGGGVGARGLNAAGQVTGVAFNPAASSNRAFFFDGATTRDLGVLPGSFASRGIALNGVGQVAGWSEVPGTKAFSWTEAGGIVGISPEPFSIAQALNDSGLVVGIGLNSANAIGGFSWSAGTGFVDHRAAFQRLEAVNNGGTMAGRDSGGRAALRQPGGTVLPLRSDQSVARLINDAGLVAGQVGGSPSSGHAFAWQGGTGYAIGDVFAAAGYVQSLALDLNQVGQVVGYATAGATFENRGFLWSVASGVNATSMVGFPGESGGALPRAINNHGIVVGAAGSPQRAFVWSAATGMIDLATRVVNPPSGLFLLEASAINDSGQIVARTVNGLVLLTPASPDTPVPPTLGTIAAADPVAVGTPVSASIAFSDYNSAETHTAQWNWGDGTSEAGSVSESGGAGTVSGTHTFATAGVYRVVVTVTDRGGQSASVGRDLVVYDPAGGYVSGSGWFESPFGAFGADSTLAGRADFGFVAKYRKGANVPSGQTTFQFQAGNLRFRSDAYDWLVVAGARAQYKGVGTLNGVAGYRFMLTAVDGDQLGGGTRDRFRIRIWHFDAGINADVVDYDNQVDADGAGGNQEGTALGGGSIVIQK